MRCPRPRFYGCHLSSDLYRAGPQKADFTDRFSGIEGLFANQVAREQRTRAAEAAATVDCCHSARFARLAYLLYSVHDLRRGGSPKILYRQMYFPHPVTGQALRVVGSPVQVHENPDASARELFQRPIRARIGASEHPFCHPRATVR